MDFTEGTLSVLCSVGLYYSIKALTQNIINDNNRFQYFNSLQIYTPTQIAELLKQSDNNTKIDAFVSGVLKGEKCIDSVRPLIMSLRKVFDQDFFNNKQYKLQRIDWLNEFIIQDNNNKINIYRNGSINFRGALDYIQSYFKQQEFTQEYGIVSEQFYMVMGEVSKQDGKLIMNNPQFILRDKKQLIDQIRAVILIKKSIINLMKIGLAVFIIAILFNLIKFSIQIFKKLRKQYLDKLRNVSSLKISNFDCIICCTKHRNVILKPCKHFAICSYCLDKLTQPKCPICQRQIEDKIEIFIV